jgi:predicted DNA-binding transcriptional regulator AlpA
MPNASPSPPATLRPRDLWTLLSISKSKLYRDDALGLIPKGFAVGASRRWLRDDILGWIEAGTPSAKEWAAMRRQSDGKRR